MRKINCRNVRREIEEAGAGDSLRWVVNKHLSTCPACATVAREQTKLREIVASLGTVEAPGDFDFRLRARLAADKRRPQPFALVNVSFGIRSAAMAMMLILAGAAILFIALKTRTDNSVPEAVADAVQQVKPANPTAGTVATVVKAPDTVDQSNTSATGDLDSVQSLDPSPAKRRATGQATLASYRANRTRSQDMSGTGAVVLKGEQLAEGYPGSAFPIDASYQSLKVSIDDGNGSSRTISLPTVSFGSQRALSQGALPQMVAARGAW